MSNPSRHPRRGGGTIRAPVVSIDSSDYQLVQLQNGAWSVRSNAEGETFHPVIGPVAEAESLYVQQLELPRRVAESAGKTFVVWDVGLGAAANTLTALRALREIPGHSVRMVSFDHTPIPLEFALPHAEPLGYFGGYENHVAGLLKEGAVEFAHGSGTVRWEFHGGDFPTQLASSDAAALPCPQAILFDAFSPARNAAMWTLPLFRSMRDRVDPLRPCSLATYSRATLFRVSLLRAGWFVGAGSATGEKEETTVAASSLELLRRPLDATWLGRALRSTSAEPLEEPAYRQAPLSEASRQALMNHPQFR